MKLYRSTLDSPASSQLDRVPYIVHEIPKMGILIRTTYPGSSTPTFDVICFQDRLRNGQFSDGFRIRLVHTMAERARLKGYDLSTDRGQLSAMRSAWIHLRTAMRNEGSLLKADRELLERLGV